MKQTVSETDFLDAFRAYGRADQFTRAGLIALYDYLEELEADTGEEVELDVIALCCDYSEYATALEAAKDLSDYEVDEALTEEETEADALAWLNEQTSVIEFDGGVIVAAF
jgi:hypothetical protein